MSHIHYCDVAGHGWECEGIELRPLTGDLEPAFCICPACQVPMEQGDHGGCAIELLACPDHLEEQQQKIHEAKRQLIESNLSERWERIESLPDGNERDALIEECVEWSFPTREIPRDDER